MVSTPELKKYMDKKIVLTINSKRKIAGILRGYDIFLNIVLDDAIEIIQNDKDKNTPIHNNLGQQTVIRGNSIIAMEPLDPVI